MKKQLRAGAEKTGTVRDMSIVFGPFANPGREHSEVLTHSSLRNCCCSLFLQATYWLNREGKEKAKDRRQKAEIRKKIRRVERRKRKREKIQ